MTQHEELVWKLRGLGGVNRHVVADALESQSREIAALKERGEGLRTELQRAKNALNATVHHIAADAHKTGGSW